MIIDEKGKSYYALTFTNHVYNSSLRLIKGSLNSPTFKFVGNKIPYTFHDINSFADLYYSPASKKLVSAIVFYDKNQDRTTIKTYTLLTPPEASLDNIDKISFFGKIKWYGLILIVILIGLLSLIYIKWIKNKKVGQVSTATTLPYPEKTEDEEENEEQIGLPQEEDVPNTIYLFGDLQLINKDGKDITKQFTPVIKELFLLILLFTVRWGRGISSEKLEELLWFDKPIDSARNNRSVNITKLKSLLESMDECQVSKETGHWKLIIDSSKLNIDYIDYQNTITGKKKLSKQNVNDLTKILNRGNFLSNSEYSWLDTLKAEITDQVIDAYLHTAAEIKVEDDPEFVITIANCVLSIDPVNEDAVALKCKTLVALGKHSLAKSIFEKFNKEYKAIYSESFGKSFQEILG